MLQIRSIDGGLFGLVSTYFGTGEINGWGILYLHCLVWLQGAHNIQKLRQKLLDCPEFTTSFLGFIDSIIKCSLPGPEDNSVIVEK